jgi:predicted Zn finger-like uncharacterized protein
MPTLVECPSCSRKLRVPDELLGQRVKCPTCSSVFTAGEQAGGAPPAPEEPAEDRGRVTAREPSPREREDRSYQEEPVSRRRPRFEDEDDFEGPGERTGRRGARADRSAWQKVRTGITMILTSICIIIGSVVLLFCGSCLMGMAMGAAGAGGRGGPGAGGAAAGLGGLLILVILFLIAMLISLILQITGYAFCMFAPPKHGARVLAITAFGLTIGSLLLTFTAIGVDILGGALGASVGNPMAMGAGRSVGSIVQMVSYLMSVAGLIVFLFFLRSVAISIRNQGLVQSVQHLLILGGVMIVGWLGMFGLSFFIVAGAAAAGPGPPGAAGDALAGVGILMLVCGCGELILVVVWFAWYVGTLVQIRAALGDYISRRAW